MKQMLARVINYGLNINRGKPQKNTILRQIMSKVCSLIITISCFGMRRTKQLPRTPKHYLMHPDITQAKGPTLSNKTTISRNSQVRFSSVVGTQCQTPKPNQMSHI